MALAAEDADAYADAAAVAGGSLSAVRRPLSAVRCPLPVPNAHVDAEDAAARSLSRI